MKARLYIGLNVNEFTTIMRTKSLNTLLILLSAVFASCIGTDIVEQELVPERVQITSKADSIKIGENFTFEAQYFDNLGNPVASNFLWESSDPAIISIDANGVAQANSSGNATLTVRVNEASDATTVNAGEVTSAPVSERSGVFTGNRDYVVNGDFTLSDETGDLVLTFANNFSTSNGPGLYVYLTNSESSVSGGVEVGRLKSNNGGQTYNVTGDVNVNTYNYVLIYCKPFGIPFGIGQFEDE